MLRFFKSPAIQYLGLFALLAVTLFSVLASLPALCVNFSSQRREPLTLAEAAPCDAQVHERRRAAGQPRERGFEAARGVRIAMKPPTARLPPKIRAIRSAS